MEIKDKLKEIHTKNCTCYYFDVKIIFWDRDIDFSDILLNEKLHKQKYKNIFMTFHAKPLRIRFDKIAGFIKIHDKIRYLVSFDYSYCDEICDQIKYLVSEKSCIKDSINQNFGKINIDSYNSLPIEKILNFHNV